AFACAAFVRNGQMPRTTSAIVPFSEPGGSVPLVDARFPAGPQSSRLTGLPSVPTIEPTSTSVWSVVPHESGALRPPVPRNGIPVTVAGAPGAVTESAGAKTCEFETAATAIPSGAVAGDPVDPSPQSSRSFPAAITGTTPAAAVLSIAGIKASFAGSVCGPP